ncbi:peptidylprolyl isomerase [Marivirga tractuosa]|uniref:Periplasmic chaperone PpiD n=1 Tax=Marivirga tractuosa (strain ATCC 23168 / DSM 4126 / NBRC 15989 / NCIMB 1408 / VKM B-1430 / H-43) TaxID=643867 RepID=E4TTT6_MARTH|nr:peptidylprolyl isomerase [Marivirga tractuosa]ADR21991.1 PpiC-type peptidyl-prolyl cis-trans isomerase [Marivirga tractuosa DSM 4126]BDD13549.1 peptidylprolyl isomerase [Marivirga tractuosa]
MGVFNTLRVKMGSVLIALIGLSILAFLLTDLLGPDSMLLGGGRSNDVGEIAGKTINLPEYQRKVEEFRNNFRAGNGRAPSDQEMNSIRQQAWDFLIIEKAFQEQYDELGLEVTNEELVDMVQGDNISPIVKRNFTNPETGEFNKEQVVNMIRNIAQAPAEQQAQWYSFESSLVPARARAKYDELLGGSTYITKAEAERAYKKETENAEVEYLYVPFYSVVDSLVTPTDSELKSYYNEHKDQYKTDASRTISYISIELLPSGEDSTMMREEIEELKTEFQKVDDDSAFARLNSDRSNSYRTYPIAQLPKILASNTNIIKEGDVLGPFIDEGAYVLYKASKIFEDTVSSVKASHILIEAEDDSDEADAQARKEAREVLQKAQSGQDFAELAKDFSDGPSATRGGDLGWFREGQMVDEFNEAVFAKSGTGVINEVIKTQYGYHIIKVTEEKTAKTYEIATIHRDIIPTETTRDRLYRKADLFAASNKNYAEFTAAAEENNYSVRSSGKMSPNQRSIGTLGSAREIVRWAFTDASEGKVSDVFETNTHFVVAVLTSETEKGTSDFKEVKALVSRAVKEKQKGEIIKEKLSGLSGTLNEMASAYGADANVYTSNDVNISSNSLPNVGQAPKVIGTIFGMELNTQSQPLEANNGIVIVKVLNRTPAPEIADYTSYKDQLAQNRSNNVSFAIKSAIEEKAEIVDERYKFY